MLDLHAPVGVKVQFVAFYDENFDFPCRFVCLFMWCEFFFFSIWKAILVVVLACLDVVQWFLIQLVTDFLLVE